jgi:hypothetical protein
LWEREHEGQVAVDAVLLLEDLGGLDSLPGGGDLDQDALLGDTDGLVELVSGWHNRFAGSNQEVFTSII